MTTWKEKVGLRNRRYIGVDRILWESEFPRATSTYPESASMIGNNFQDVPGEEREQILWRNAAKLYKLAHLTPLMARLVVSRGPSRAGVISARPPLLGRRMPAPLKPRLALIICTFPWNKGRGLGF